jgi:hypothetical protein
MIDESSVPPRSETTKSLKGQNRWQLWLVVAANSLFLYGVVQANSIKLDGLRAVFSDSQKLIPIGLALVVATVLNGVLSTDVKARLVFLRWRNVLPGHRAFSQYAISDPRIDPAALAKLIGSDFPVQPLEQNRMWYRLYRTIENDPAVREVHRDFLLLRDYAGLSVLFTVLYGAVGFFTIRSLSVGLLYFLLLIVQYLAVRQAAENYGVRFVTTVLALKASKQAIKQPKKTRGAVGGTDV